MSANPISIREATVRDVETILRFIRELAEYEKAEHEVSTTTADLTQTLFGVGANAHALICEADGNPIGFAVYFFNYSTWQGRQGLYLEDLYVTPKARGAGVGKALLTRLAQIALENDCRRFEWSVLDWNTPAIGFYESLGARPQTQWVRYRLTGAALSALGRG